MEKEAADEMEVAEKKTQKGKTQEKIKKRESKVIIYHSKIKNSKIKMTKEDNSHVQIREILYYINLNLKAETVSKALRQSESGSICGALYIEYLNEILNNSHEIIKPNLEMKIILKKITKMEKVENYELSRGAAFFDEVSEACKKKIIDNKE